MENQSEVAHKQATSALTRCLQYERFERTAILPKPVLSQSTLIIVNYCGFGVNYHAGAVCRRASDIEWNGSNPERKLLDALVSNWRGPTSENSVAAGLFVGRESSYPCCYWGVRWGVFDLLL